jgi:hypothetical protein
MQGDHWKRLTPLHRSGSQQSGTWTGALATLHVGLLPQAASVLSP